MRKWMLVALLLPLLAWGAALAATPHVEALNLFQFDSLKARRNVISPAINVFGASKVVIVYGHQDSVGSTSLYADSSTATGGIYYSLDGTNYSGLNGLGGYTQYQVRQDHSAASQTISVTNSTAAGGRLMTITPYSITADELGANYIPVRNIKFAMTVQNERPRCVACAMGADTISMYRPFAKAYVFWDGDVSNYWKKIGGN